MTSQSRLLLGTVAGKLDRTELIAAVFLCRDLVKEPGQLDKVNNAFDLMDVLEQQKVIDVESNDWHRLVDVLRSKVVRRNDLAKLVSAFEKQEQLRREEEKRKMNKKQMEGGIEIFIKDIFVIPGHSPDKPPPTANKTKSMSMKSESFPGRRNATRRKQTSSTSSGSDSEKTVMAILKHPDWNFSERLTQGESAIVYKGEKVKKRDSSSPASKDVCELPPQDVVGKVYRRDGRLLTEKQFLRQADVLRQIGNHDSIVQLLAVLRDDVAVPCLVLELATRKDLQTYLSTDAGRQTSITKIIKWAAKVADGMSFMASKGYIHANLRASSVLLFTDDAVKISGFSVSRHSDDVEACKIKDDEQLAWKWLAPEVMQEHMLRPLSDIWSFGILVIELLQYGAEPYPDVSQLEDLQAKLKDSSYHHPKPASCPAAFYNDILVNCWQPRTERPSFDLLKVAVKDSLFKPIRRKNQGYINQMDAKGSPVGLSERTMIDNERYLSVAVRTTLGQSISNQYIDCAGMQSVWTDFGDWEVEPDTFILQDVIGCGYFGIVWKGQLTTGKEVAVKTCASDAMNPDSFMKEVRFMTALNHAHIVKLYGVCTRHNTEMFIVTELMANGDLRHYLMNDAGDKIHLPELLSFAEQISDALAYVEQLNAVHRDIAARNVLVAADGTTAKLSDFGMSRFLTSDHYPLVDDVRIPLLWAAPEVVDRRKYTIKSDVWSFGILMVELFLYGERPYDELEPREVYSAIVGGYRHPKPDKCPDHVYQLMLSCWNGDPFARPSFADLHSMLSQSNADDRSIVSTHM